MKLRLFLAKITRFEYWSSWVFYIPLLPYYFFQAVKNRSFTFPLLANPSMEMGGLLGTSKYSILQKINEKYLPKTLFFAQKIAFDDLKRQVILHRFKFPIIAKPDVGERGLNVKLIENFIELEQYLNQTKSNFIVQQYIDFPIELGVFYSRLPNEKQGKISSLTLKEFLQVRGDGKSNIEELMHQSIRASFQIETMRNKLGERFMQSILPKGETHLLEPIGNHCRGTKFIDGKTYINASLEQVFDAIAGNLEGIYYGRFDLKVPNFEDLYAGKNIKILELNGINSEPTHIYDPNYKLLEAYKDVLWHWKRVSIIAQQNKQKGEKILSLKEAIHKTNAYFAYKKMAMA